MTNRGHKWQNFSFKTAAKLEQSTVYGFLLYFTLYLFFFIFFIIFSSSLINAEVPPKETYPPTNCALCISWFQVKARFKICLETCWGKTPLASVGVPLSQWGNTQWRNYCHEWHSTDQMDWTVTAIQNFTIQYEA